MYPGYMDILCILRYSDMLSGKGGFHWFYKVINLTVYVDPTSLHLCIEHTELTTSYIAQTRRYGLIHVPVRMMCLLDMCLASRKLRLFQLTYSFCLVYFKEKLRNCYWKSNAVQSQIFHYFKPKSSLSLQFHPVYRVIWMRLGDDPKFGEFCAYHFYFRGQI